MNLPYTTVQDLVVDMKAKYFDGFYVLPYNRFDVDHSQHWWLSPTSDKAAFRYAKAMFTTEESWVDPGSVFCGFNVEKGVLHEGGWNKNAVMDETWFWHRFLDLAGHPLAGIIEEASTAAGANLQLFVSAGTLTPNAEWPRVLFDIAGTTLSRQHYRPCDGKLADVAACTDLSGFAAAIRSLDGTPTAWEWADVLIGMPFTLDPNGPDNLDRCAAMLKPFERWMRAS